MKSYLGKEYNVMTQIDMNGRNMFVVELPSARYVDDLMVTHVIVTPSQFEKFVDVADKVEVVND